MSVRWVRHNVPALAVACSLIAGSGTLGAQRQGAIRTVPISRVDTLLAHGRLAAAEQALYAAVEARPRAPEARGALAWYLASRARFGIADVLFTEALRFGADSESVRRARATIAPYAVRVAGAPSTIPFEFAEDARTIGHFVMRVEESVVRGVLDPNAAGLTAGSAATARAMARGVWIGERQLRRQPIAVDTTLPAGEVRVGLDVLFGHAPVFDEGQGSLTLGGVAAASRAVGLVVRIPFVLSMPGVWLVERPGVAPVSLESPHGRALLRGARWRLDPEQSVVVVER